MNDVLLTGGGIIPDADMQKLNAMGVGKLFGPGTDSSEMVTYIKEEVAKKRSWKLEAKN